jgi:hypothetical protein
MKEYIAETGGRYTYSDDILNLQELSLSMTAIFEGCSNFIISGCGIAGTEISPGYVWINGKVRRFAGCKDAVFPYYIYEKNNNDTVVYANEINKRGRCNYLCTGGTAVPTQIDAVTGLVPGFIELRPDYSPRFMDKFFGRYAVLLDTPFARQTVKKEIVLAGKLSGEKDMESKTALSVVNPSNGYSLKNMVKTGGDASVGVYFNGLLINEILIKTDGAFSFIKQGQEIAVINENGIVYTHSSSTTSQTGSILVYGSHLINTEDATDEGAVNINAAGYQQGGTKFRNFNVYNGKSAATPVFQVIGKTETVTVNGLFNVKNSGKGIRLAHTGYSKTDKRLTNTLTWADNAGEAIACIGYESDNSFDFICKNSLGNMVISPKGYLDITGELRINGTGIGNIYVSQSTFTTELGKKVTAIAGKGLSSEDFTKAYKDKLDAISSGNLTGGEGGSGYALASEVSAELAKKLSIAQNLSDLQDKAAARTHLDVYSKAEAGGVFLKISSNLLELVSLSATEMNGLSAEQILAKKAEKQTAVRLNLDAEKKGTGDLKLAKASNLSDLPDKATARTNISVYSKSEIDNFLKDKLSNDGAYAGELFTAEHKTKLEGIKTGNFQATGINQTEGYVLVSAAVTELAKKANLLLDGYNDTQKTAIAGNLNVYQKAAADTKFAARESQFQDYITYLAGQGKTTTEAQKILRDKLNAPSKEDVTDNYLRKDSRLSDLVLSNTDAQKLACQKLGAAFASDYQTKLLDTGWLQMSNSGNATDTSRLFIRQIGNIVCIQGIINTAKRDGSNWGGTVAVIPNQISPPKYGLRVSFANYNENHTHNRGSSFIIQGNTRKILLYESDWYNIDTEIHFTYMT